MAKFTAHTAVHGEDGTVFFGPGDAVPKWAADKVGDHVTDAGKSAEVEAEASTGEESAGNVEPEPETAPDFTAARQTRQRRK